MIHDYRALETARKDAAEVIETNALDNNPAFEPIRSYLESEGVYTLKLD